MDCCRAAKPEMLIWLVWFLLFGLWLSSPSPLVNLFQIEVYLDLQLENQLEIQLEVWLDLQLELENQLEIQLEV